MRLFTEKQLKKAFFLYGNAIPKKNAKSKHKLIIVYQYQQDLDELKTLKYDWTLDPSEFPKKQILFLQYGQSEGLNLQYCNQDLWR